MTKKKIDPKDALIEQLMAMVKSQQAGNATANKPAITSLYVGLRNISGVTIGVPAWNGEAAFSIHAPRPGQADPQVVAVISWPRWMELRKSSLYGNGLIKRDDSVLGESYPPGPADLPQELHPNHAVNAIEDPVAWIESKNEQQLREAIDAITSEDSLRFLLGTVDEKVRELRRQYLADGQDSAKELKAAEALPVMYQFVETRVVARLQQIGPQRDGDGLPAFVRGR